MCRVLGVSPSGYWAWTKRPPSARSRSDEALIATIRQVHADSRGTYGVPRIHAELRFEGTRCSRKRIARLMRVAGIEGVHRRRFVRTTSRDRSVAPAPDLVNRTFVADRPDRLWVADITYLPTWQGFLYLAVVVDVFSRMVVGWSMAGHLRTELIVVGHRHGHRPTPSDRRARPPLRPGHPVHEHRLRPALLARLASSWHGLDRRRLRQRHGRELLRHARDRAHRPLAAGASRADARLAVFDYIEAFYNPIRRHSGLGTAQPSRVREEVPFGDHRCLTVDRPRKRDNSRLGDG